MTTTSDPALTISIERDFAAPPGEVFTRWTDAAALARWFAPAGYRTLSAQSDAREGGAWRLTFRSESGHEYSEQGVFRELSPGRRLVLTLSQIDGDVAHPETLVTVDLDDIGTPQAPRTRMRFEQSGFRSAALRQDNEEGWRGCFVALDHDLGQDSPDDAAAERELRELFERWFEASARKDLDASMEPIDASIVSYEHGTPQEYRGLDAVREVCAGGFEYQTGDFRWDIPDLQVHVSGHLAVTWGLNRMRSVLPDGTERVEWSRGSRVFRRIDGEWKMIHQHVSFPVDAEGRASMEL